MSLEQSPIQRQRPFFILIMVTLLSVSAFCQQTPPITQQDTNPQQPLPTTTPYKRIHTSQQFHTLFSQQINKISLSEVVNATYLSNGKQMCADSKPCEFFYYVIKPKFNPQELSSFDISKNNNVKNIVVVAGMHGNEYLGPMSLLYAVKHLESPGTRIILFPLANPSGFDHQRRLVFPTNIDPNRDFPIEQYTKCYQSSSSLIIDHIYRKYHIDLTIALHNGRSQIGWNWGTTRQNTSSQTRDQPIYRDIGEWLKFVGGFNKKIQMEEFTIGTMNEVIYPVKGGFEDWAYAASWYNASVPMTPTRSCPFQKFPYNMTNGLVFLFELGPFDVNEQLFGSEEGLNVHPYSPNPSNGYVTRTVRMLKGLMKLPNPRLQLKFTNENTIIKLNGCKSGTVQSLQIFDKSSNTQYLALKEKLEFIGNINNKTVQPTKIQLQRSFSDQSLQKFDQIHQLLTIQYTLSCDQDWFGKGETIFGQNRNFKVKETLALSAKQTKFLPQTFYQTEQEALQSYAYIGGKEKQDKPYIEDFLQKNSQLLVVFIILLVVLVTVVFILYVLCKEITKDRKQRKMKRLMKKLQKINTNEADSSITSEEDIPIENTLQQVSIVKKSPQKPKKVDSYPHFCQSDKSMKTQQLDSQNNVKV